MKVNRLAIFGFRSRGGFALLPDMITAMSIVALLVVVLSIALGAQRRAERRINDQLLALRQAEETLAKLQSRPQHKSEKTLANVHITGLSKGWSRITVTINHATASLIGPVREQP